MTKKTVAFTGDLAALQAELVRLEKEFLELRMAKSTGQVKDNSRFKKVKAEIARLHQQSHARRS